MIRHAPSIGLGIGLSLRGYGGAPAGFSPEALNYFSRLDTAGDTTYTAYKQPLANYIDGLIAQSMWDGLASAASFVGVGIEGVTVPLRSDMPVLTNNNFVGADLNVLTGMEGDGTTKYLATGIAGNSIGQDNVSLSIYNTEQTTSNTFLIGNGNVNGTGAIRRLVPTYRANGAEVIPLTPWESGIIGVNRSSSTSVDYRNGSTSGSAANASSAPLSNEYYVFSRDLGGQPSNPRLATYHIGESIDLAALETLQDTLIAEIAAI